MTYATYQTRSIAPHANSCYLIRAQGRGSTKKEAIDNAVRQAVRDVIFNDIQVTYGDHKPLKRLINDPSTEQKNETFFNNFFQPGGDYARYAQVVNEDKDEFSNGENYKTVILNVIVNRGELKSYLSGKNLK